MGCRCPKERAPSSSVGVLASILIKDDNTASAGTGILVTIGVGGTTSNKIVPARLCGLAFVLLNPAAVWDISWDGILTGASQRIRHHWSVAHRTDSQFTAHNFSKEHRVAGVGIGYIGQVGRDGCR